MTSKVHSYSESPEISGLLYKKRGGFGKMMPNAWQYRLFIISREGVLCYYDTEVPDGRDVFDNKERGRINLRAVKYEVLQEPMEGMPTQYPIVIAPLNEEKWKLCAETREDQQRWLRVFERYLTDKSKDLDARKSQVLSYNSDGDDDVTTPYPAGMGDRSNTSRSPGSLRSRSSSPMARSNSRPPNSPTSAASRSHAHPRSLTNTSTHTGFSKSNSSVNSNSSAGSGASGGSKPVMLGKVGRKKSSKGPLRTSAPTSMFSQEYAETILVLIILNMCIYAAMTASTLWEQAVFFSIGNGVVVHTLSLRHFRVKEQETRTLRLVDEAKAEAEEQILAAARGSGNFKRAGTLSSDAKSLLSASVDEENEEADAPKGKPIPGATFQQSMVEQKLAPDHTWCRADHRQFNVRIGPDYNRYKKKAPSAAPLYEPFAVDVFCTHKRVDHASERFQLPEEYAGVNTHHPYVPPVFVLQLQIPSEPPTSLFSSAEDGPGWAILLFYRITEDTLCQLKDMSTASPAVKVFAQWCEKGPVDPAWRGRFKVINMCTNFDELGFPSAITSYNGKPVLIRRTGTIFRNPEFNQPGQPNNGNRYIEFNIHVHKFANIAKQSIHLITSRCALMNMMIGFVIEGRDNDELPETLFACIGANKPHQERGEFIFDGDD